MADVTTTDPAHGITDSAEGASEAAAQSGDAAKLDLTGRRKILYGLFGLTFFGWLGAVVFPVLSYLRPPREQGEADSAVVDAKPSDIPTNSARIVPVGREPVILVHTPDDRWVALSGKCTHLDCIVEYRPENGIIVCNCHAGYYDLTGRVTSGPPPRALKPFKVNIRGKGDAAKIVISRIES